jgi:hypothetical protein
MWSTNAAEQRPHPELLQRHREATLQPAERESGSDSLCALLRALLRQLVLLISKGPLTRLQLRRLLGGVISTNSLCRSFDDDGRAGNIVGFHDFSIRPNRSLRCQHEYSTNQR